MKIEININLQDGIQIQQECPDHMQDLQKEILEALCGCTEVQDHSTQSKSRGLATILRQECKWLDKVGQMLLEKEKDFPHQSKIGSKSLESCFLHQTTTLVQILSAYVIPHLER